MIDNNFLIIFFWKTNCTSIFRHKSVFTTNENNLQFCTTKITFHFKIMNSSMKIVIFRQRHPSTSISLQINKQYTDQIIGERLKILNQLNNWTTIKQIFKVNRTLDFFYFYIITRLFDCSI